VQGRRQASGMGLGLRPQNVT